MFRRSIRTLSLTVLALAACGESKQPSSTVQPPAAAPAGGGDAVAEAASSYRVTGGIAPAQVAKGGKATLALEIALTRPDVHVQSEFPLKVALVPSAGLAVEKHSLGHADAVDPGAKGRRWEVPLTAQAAGQQQVEATLRFALCKETEPLWCVTRNETVRASVEVR